MLFYSCIQILIAHDNLYSRRSCFLHKFDASARSSSQLRTFYENEATQSCKILAHKNLEEKYDKLLERTGSKSMGSRCPFLFLTLFHINIIDIALEGMYMCRCESMQLTLEQNIQILAISSQTSADAEVISDHLTAVTCSGISIVTLICL